MNRFSDIDSSFMRLPPVYGYHSEELVPIEKALEPINSQIKELPRYIKIAKKYCHFPSEHGLTQDQSAAIYIYTMEWGDSTLHRVLNTALRSESRHALKVWFPYLKLFDTALDKLPTVKGALWRGVPLNIGKNFVKNQSVTWWSINSCSSSVNVIKNFLGVEKNSTLFCIEAVNGKKVSGYTEYENEDEIILRLGSEFRVKSDPLHQSNDSYLVHLIEIADDDEEPLASSMGKIYVTPNSSETSDSAISTKGNEGATKQIGQSYRDMPQVLHASSAHVDIRARNVSINIPQNARWSQNGVTVAGGNGRGGKTNQLNCSRGLYVDENQTIFIADWCNHRIVQWGSNATSGQIVAGGNGEGYRLDQLNYPTDVIVDKETNSLIICDRNNRRVMKWSLQGDAKEGEILLENIDCHGLTMDDQRYLYVSDALKHEVRRYPIGEKNGTLVAGGNGKGDRLNQLNAPIYLFVDQEYSVYVSENFNHRVMKWVKGATEGILVAGDKDKGDSLNQLSNPRGVLVDLLRTVYVADHGNHRVTRWRQGMTQGEVIVGGNGEGKEASQLNGPIGLSFDQHGHLYVVDLGNNRVQRFSLEKD